MSDTPNKRLIVTMFDTVAKADLDALGKLLHKDLVWWTSGGELYPYSGTRGKVEVLSAFGAITSAFPAGLVLKPKNFVEEGNKVAFEADGYAVTGTGRVYNNVYHIQITIKDGLIVGVREYMDTAYAKAVLIDNLEIAPAHK